MDNQPKQKIRHTKNNSTDIYEDDLNKLVALPPCIGSKSPKLHLPSPKSKKSSNPQASPPKIPTSIEKLPQSILKNQPKNRVESLPNTNQIRLRSKRTVTLPINTHFSPLGAKGFDKNSKISESLSPPKCTTLKNNFNEEAANRQKPARRVPISELKTPVLVNGIAKRFQNLETDLIAIHKNNFERRKVEIEEEKYLANENESLLDEDLRYADIWEWRDDCLVQLRKAISLRE